ncbi:MAG: SCO family protein [Deltaproteobacteria bacterium HGW-Deltaproteobacteria-14]|jgi:protein SCO1/2|nr:MAG: SCO family protein [Deltaproteobacteria bacterium HGW-Deltaproteobacteria-14]
MTPRAKTRALLVTIAALAAALVATLAVWDPAGDAAPTGAALGEPVDFTLRSTDGPVQLAALRGRVVLVYFGYTACPDVCPTSLTATAAGLALLSPEERARVATLFVSVDPERDTPSRLAEYAAFFAPDIRGVTGTPAEVRAAADRFGVVYRRHQLPGSAGGYSVDHSALTYLIDPAGRLAARLPHAAPPADVAAAIRRALDPPPEETP